MPNRVRAVRVAHGFTQTELARAVGVSHATISRVETGARTGLLVVRRGIAAALDEPVEALFPAAA